MPEGRALHSRVDKHFPRSLHHQFCHQLELLDQVNIIRFLKR